MLCAFMAFLMKLTPAFIVCDHTVNNFCAGSVLNADLNEHISSELRINIKKDFGFILFHFFGLTPMAR